MLDLLFLELGTVRHKNQVNALSKILTDFAISAIAYFLVGYYIAYGQHFFHDAATLSADHGYNLMRCFFLLTFAAAIPAIISGGIAERAKMRSQALATLFLVALIYPFFEGMIWNDNLGFQDWLTQTFGASFHDFAGSVVVHAMGGWIALAAVILLGEITFTTARHQDFFANLVGFFHHHNFTPTLRSHIRRH
jgi:ammonium transporter, Amt family